MTTFISCCHKDETSRWVIMKVMMLETLYLFIPQPCIEAMMTQRYRQQSRCWWRVLSVFTNPGLWIHIAEHALSPPPQTPSSFVSLLHLNLIANFVAVIRLSLLGITALFSVSQFLFVLCFPALSHCVFPLSFSLWSGIETLPLSGLFCHALFSHFHTIVTLMKHSGRSCCSVDFPATCWRGKSLLQIFQNHLLY